MTQTRDPVTGQIFEGSAGRMVNGGIDESGNFVAEAATPELSSDAEGTSAEGEALAVGLASAQNTSADITSATLVDVLFVPDAATTLLCLIEIGTDPTAQAGSYPVSANMPYRIRKNAGSKIAAIRVVADGDLYIHPVV